MTLDNMTGITKASCTADDTFCKSQLITCNRVKECNGVCPFEDALKHADETQTMNEQHTVDHDRDWIIGCIKHDGFIKTNRFDKANQIILDALSADAEWIPCSKRLPKEDEYVGNVCKYYLIQDEYGDMHVAHLSGRGWETIESIKALGCDVIAWMPLPTPYKE